MSNANTFTMNDGSISNNTAEYGGGVYNVNTFTMNDGSISNNTAAEYGGGVVNVSTFKMLDGSIKYNNASTGGCLCVLSPNSTVIQGTASITENTIGEKESPGNVALYYGAVITLDKYTGDDIGVSVFNADEETGEFFNTSGPVTASNNTDPDCYLKFYSESYPYVIFKTLDNVVYLGTPVAQYGSDGYKFETVQKAVDSSSDGQVINMLTDSTEDVTTGELCNITLDLNGHVLKGTGNGSVITNNGALTLYDLVGGGNITGGSKGVEQSGTLTVGGKLNISGSTSNLYLNDGKTVNISSDHKLENGAKICISTSSVPVSETPVQITANGTEDDMRYFSSDNTVYGLQYNNTEEYIELALAGDELSNAGYYASLTLKDNIDINFSIKNLGENFSKEKLTITVNDKQLSGEDITVKNDGSAQTVSCVLQAVEPQNLADVLHIVVEYNSVQVKNFNYSVVDYCNAVFNAYDSYKTDKTSTQGKLYELCEALLNYGKYTGDYDNEKNKCGKPDSTLNKGHEIAFGSDYSFTGLNEKATILGKYADNDSGASLTLGSTIKLNFVLKNCTVELQNKNAETQNFYILNSNNEQIDPSRVTVTKNGEATVVSVDLYASQLARSYTLKLKDVDSDKNSVSLSFGNTMF